MNKNEQEIIPYLRYGIYGTIGVITAVTLILSMSILNRYYDVWAQKMIGKARLAEATQSRQILVQQAIAEREASVERAKAIRIVGKVAQKYPEYRRQEFIGAFAEALKDGKINQIMYIPTEASVPITEAGRAIH